MVTRVCAYCEKEKDETSFRLSRSGTRRNVCKACRAEYEYIKIKTDVFMAYGRKCACCGESIPLFLALDHIKNDGGKHRRETGYITTQMYRLVRRLGFPKDTFQLLCANCNFAKGHYGMCPHQLGKTTNTIWAEWDKILARKGKRFRFHQEKLAEPKFRERREWKSEEMAGNKFAASKMNKEMAEAIRGKQRKGISHWAIAKEFGISRQMVGLIVNRKRWA